MFRIVSIFTYEMIYPFEFPFRFVTIRILKPPSNKVVLEAQRAVEFIEGVPDWESVDTIVSTFLESMGIDTFQRLESPRVHPAGGWITHVFDMGCPRHVWIFPDPVREEGSD
jgi:hypothetical protein